MVDALTIQHLHKRYKNGVIALKDINLTIPAGDYFALLGPNGAGKTTLIGILTSLVQKTRGHVSIMGHNIDTSFAQAKRSIGVVPQEMNFSVFEKVLTILVDQAGYYGVPKRIALARAEEYLHRLSLWNKRDTMSRMLSGGMKRRLMVIRALMHNPKILILDEPTAGVDVELRHSMWAFLKELNEQGITIILTTHYLEEAESQCKHIAIIQEGEIIEHARTAHLLSRVEHTQYVLTLAEPLEKAPVLVQHDVYLSQPDTLEILLPSKTDLSEIFAQLHQQNIKVINVNNKFNRLEKFYMSVTTRGTSPAQKEQ